MTRKASSDYLLELLVEEMPAGAMPGGRAELARRFTDELQEANLPAESVESIATPRRLALVVRGVALRQEDRVVEVSGPPVEKAIDADGRPTKMAEGFARAQGVELSELRRAKTPKGEVLLARKTIPGRAASEILADIS